MIKPVFSIKNILKFIVFASLAILFWYLMIGMLVLTFIDDIEVFNFKNTGGTMMLLIFPAIGNIMLTAKALSQVVPKYFVCMRAVRAYIKFNDLKELLADETFAQVEFPKEVKEELTKSKIKLKKFDLQISENWVYSKGIYIPKTMILALGVKLCSNPPTSFSTIDDKFYEIEHFSKATEFVISYLNDGKEIPMLKMSDDKQEKHIQYFKENVKTKTDFLNFIK